MHKDAKGCIASVLLDQWGGEAERAELPVGWPGDRDRSACSAPPGCGRRKREPGARHGSPSDGRVALEWFCARVLAPCFLASVLQRCLRRTPLPSAGFLLVADSQPTTPETSVLEMRFKPLVQTLRQWYQQNGSVKHGDKRTSPSAQNSSSSRLSRHARFFMLARCDGAHQTAHLSSIYLGIPGYLDAATAGVI